MRFFIFYFLFFWLINSFVYGQKILSIEIQSLIDKKENIYFVEKDSISMIKKIHLYRDERLKKGFWQDEYHIKKSKKDTLFIVVQSNQKLKWENLKIGNLPRNLADNINFKEKYFRDTDFNWKDWEKLSQKIIQYSQNNGSPFAQVFLDSTTIFDDKISAVIHYKSEKAFYFDSIKIKGNTKIEKWFLMTWLGIKAGQTYQHQKILQINRRIKEMPYLSLENNPVVNFRENLGTITLEINKKNANRFDGIIGILPNEEKQGQVLITGDVNITLKNIGQRGIGFAGRWQRLQTQAQWLELNYEHPLLFRRNFDLQLGLQSIKQDSSFLNLDLKASLLYRLPNRAKLSINIQNRRSNLGASNTFQQVTQLPQISDGQYTSYGLGYDWQDLDDVFYPKQGQKIKISGQWGYKSITKNPFWSDTLYKNVPLKTAQWIFNVEYLHYFRLQKRATLLLKTNFMTLNNSFLVFNDLTRVGGLQSLRGFNENSFFASTFLLATAEYRYFWENESYLFLFFDQAFIQQKTFKEELNDTPFGTGVGLSFTTQAGIFQVAYALGQSKGQNFSTNRAKIHLGFVARF